MTDLTLQWRKGELPEGWYWVKRVTWSECINMLYNWSDTFLDGDVPVDNDNIIEVLAKVPDYKEWKQLKEQINKYYLDVINRGTANAVKAVKEFGMPERIEELVKQNAQLKELLKEWVQFEIEENPNDFTVMSERMSELANKTKEVLK